MVFERDRQLERDHRQVLGVEELELDRASPLQLVEGLPLGIELAAAWIRVLSCEEIAQEIARNLDFLSSAMQDLPERQRSLRAVFDYSWNLLAPPEQQALRQLAIFRGSFTREAVRAVLSSEFKVLSSAQNNAELKTQNSELLTLLAALVDIA